MVDQVNFDEALADAKSDPDMMDSIASALGEVKRAVQEIGDDLTDDDVLLNNPAKVLREYVKSLDDALDKLDEYGHAKQHYKALLEHF